MKPKLSDILIAKTGLQHPNQLGIWLLQQAKLKTNPIDRAVVVALRRNDDPDICWSEMGVQDLDTILRFFEIAIRDVFREQWYDFLAHPEDDVEDIES